MTSNADLAELLNVITDSHLGVPVRPMEEVLAVGAGAAEVVLDALARHRHDDERAILWLIVLLGELRAPAAIPALIRELTSPDTLLRVVASEALAKLGTAALPALREVIASGSEIARLHAYGALGWIAHETAHAALLDALGSDDELLDVIAMALVDHGRRDDVAALHEAYRRCRPGQRSDLAAAIEDLHWQVRHEVLARSDWRLRHYIRSTELGIDIGWLGVCAILHEHPDPTEADRAPPLRTLDELTATAPEPLEPVEHCESCGALIEQPTGLPVCPENAVGAVRLQLDYLAGEREEGFDDLFDILNDIEAELWELDDEGGPRSRQARAERQEALDELGFLRATCEWCLRQGAETVGSARAHLLAEFGRLIDRYGDEPAAPVRRDETKVGRNDPCPCGSGRKYKRCCG